MKRYVLLVALVAFLGLSAFTASGQLITTTLKITVLNDLGNPVDSVKVTLYASEKDYLESKNPVVPPAYTDAKGVVRFKNLEPRSYFVDAEKGDLSNAGGGVQTQKLDQRKANKVNIIIQ